MDRLAGIAAYIVCDLLASGQLVRVLKDHPNLEMESVALYPHRRYMTAKVRVFIDMLVERFADEQRWLDAMPESVSRNGRSRRATPSLPCVPTKTQSLGRNGGGGPGDLQVAGGVGEHDPLRRLARGARNGKYGRLPRRQYRLEPFNRRVLPHARRAWSPPRGGRRARRGSRPRRGGCHHFVEGWSPELSKHAQLCHHAWRTQGHHK